MHYDYPGTDKTFYFKFHKLLYKQETGLKYQQIYLLVLALAASDVSFAGGTYGVVNVLEHTGMDSSLEKNSQGTIGTLNDCIELYSSWEIFQMGSLTIR